MIPSLLLILFKFNPTVSFVVLGTLWDSEQTLQGSSEEHWPGDESRDDGCRRAGKDAEQLPSGRLGGVTAGWSGGETQRPKEEGGWRIHTHSPEQNVSMAEIFRHEAAVKQSY